MQRWFALAVTLTLAAFAILQPQKASSQAGAAALVDGKSLDAWNAIGDANWKVVDGAIVADKGNGFLVSKTAYGDFQIDAEFWADSDVNSGVFIRCEEPANLTSKNCYEVNIWDSRPSPEYGTGAIVDVGKVDPMPKAGGKWNTYQITAKGSHLTVVLNGVKTVDVEDAKHKAGAIGLQHGIGAAKDGGVIKFRKVDVKPL